MAILQPDDEGKGEREEEASAEGARVGRDDVNSPAKALGLCARNVVSICNSKRRKVIGPTNHHRCCRSNAWKKGGERKESDRVKTNQR